ncbi:DUF4349 domain-containing protein [Glycomyces harbinensis]|uniref:DUF4349 domain-containing protein n=1 Tax=Glycomyces harbinensis TaxID=58114 RepID=A0A1G6RP52_9ACTN|nr:DUF4349 domain-containing protein [Glycomyces harbinensis]SDD06419.1 protein of unknown function [Glycomyces harbinensis]
MRLHSLSIVAVSAALLLFGCASDGEDAGGGVAQDLAEPEAADTASEQDAANAQFDAGDRAVIYEAALGVTDADPERVAEEAWDLAESFGGFVTDDQRDRAGDGGEYAAAHLVLRVPSEHFLEAMDGLAALAEEETQRSVTTEDVTEATVDLASHIASKTASVERVRALLADAASVDAILELESELARREGELASLEAQLEDLQDRVALSTIDFTVSTPSAPREQAGYTGPDSFWDGLTAGFSGAVALLVGLSVALGVVLPFLPIAAIGAAAVIVPMRWARRRRAGRAGAEPPAAGSPLPPVRR